MGPEEQNDIPTPQNQNGGNRGGREERLEAVPSTDNALHRFAREALDCGFTVIPAHPNRSKAPFGSWKQYQLRLPTIGEIDNWYGPHKGIGVVTGQVSGNLEMLEFEGEALADGTFARFDAAIDKAGLGPSWLRIATGYQEESPSGGLHYFWKCDEISGNQKLASNSQGHTLIETRGEGGYSIIAPSSGLVHPSGKPWTLVNGGLRSIETITPEERQAILVVSRSLDESSIVGPTQVGSSPQVGTSPEDDRPGTRYDNESDAVEKTLLLLEDAGWKRGQRDPDGTIHLTRPGKDPREGTSATLNSPKTGSQFYVFSTNAQPFEAERTYSPFAVLAILQHEGNFSAAASQLVASSETSFQLVLPAIQNDAGSRGDGGSGDPLSPDRSEFVDLLGLISGDLPEQEWLVEPLIPAGRQTSVYAKGKTGKSLLLLDIACRLSSGQKVLMNPAGPPMRVLYVDFEMTPADLQERLLDMGYTENDPLSETLAEHIRYLQLPTLEPLDTPTGGAELCKIAVEHSVELVIIDTLIRALEGEENSADTIKRFNQFTGMPLKVLGITLVRIDHSGKAKGKGPRGSSAKGDDVDLVWRLDGKPTIGGVPSQLFLKREASRVSWVPERVELIRQVEPILFHELAGQIPSGKIEDNALQILKRFQPLLKENNILPCDVTNQIVKELLEENGLSVGRTSDLRQAVKWVRRNGYYPNI